MKTLIKYLVIAVLGVGLTLPQTAFAQGSRVRIGGGQSSSKPKPKPKPKPESKPRSNHKPAQAPTPADQSFTVNGVTFTVIGVQGGTFTMGATSEQSIDDYDDYEDYEDDEDYEEGEAFDDEKPAHRVTLSSFSIGQTEVTQELWEAVMGSNPSCFKGPKLPVERVSWNDCQKFIKKLNALTGQNFRLPTEAEWEYAARGGGKSKGYKYSGSNNLDDVAWNVDNSGDETHDVATKQPNELGIYDMSGNVYEWCQDWYGESYYSSSPTSNPTGPASGSYRVCRGGSGCDDGIGPAEFCRVACRWKNDADFSWDNIGLRLAL